jgi:hypothetical protein
MVAPVIAGTARVVTTMRNGTGATGSIRTRGERAAPRLQGNRQGLETPSARYQSIDTQYRTTRAGYNSIAKTRDARLRSKEEQRGEDIFFSQTASNPTSPEPVAGKIASAQKMAGVVKTSSKMLRITLIIGSLLAPIMVLQIIFWLIAMAGIGIEMGSSEVMGLIPGVGDGVNALARRVIPGYELFGLAWAINIVLGLLAVVIALVVMSAHGVAWYRGTWVILAIAITIGLYVNPILQPLPWVFLLLFLVWLDRVRDRVTS